MKYGCSKDKHVVLTSSTINYFSLPDRKHQPRLVHNCMVYDFNCNGIHKHIVVQLDKFTQDNIKDMEELPYSTFDISADKQNGRSFYCKGFLPVLKFGNIVGYIHVVSVDERIELTNNKANKYVHNRQIFDDADHHVLTFGKVVLFAVESNVLKLLITNPKITNKQKVDIYILNDSLKAINCHTEYSSLRVDDMYKLHIRQQLVLVIRYSKELRFMTYRRKKLINMSSIHWADDEIFKKASIMKNAIHNKIVFFGRNNLTSITRLII